MTAIFPALPGLGWSVTKTPRFAGRIQNAISGRELRVLDQVNPIWTWTLTYSLLRDRWDARAATGPGAGYDELRTLAGFFLQQQGTFRPFLFDDPTDNTVADQVWAPATAARWRFSSCAAWAGSPSRSPRPNVVSAIRFNGVRQDPAGYTVDSETGLVTFTTPPPAGQIITADFTYRFRVRFAEDSAEFENFMYQLWQLKQIKLQSVLR